MRRRCALPFAWLGVLVSCAVGFGCGGGEFSSELSGNNELDGADGDGGGGGTFTMACSPANDHWVTVTGDCDDGNKDVNPLQTNWFDKYYTNSVTGVVSYDYDCKNGEEEEDPNVAKSAGACSLLSG